MLVWTQHEIYPPRFLSVRYNTDGYWHNCHSAGQRLITSHVPAAGRVQKCPAVTNRILFNTLLHNCLPSYKKRRVFFGILEKKKKAVLASHPGIWDVKWFPSCFYHIWMHSSLKKKHHVIIFCLYLPLPPGNTLPLSVIIPQFAVFPVSLRRFLLSPLIFQYWSFLEVCLSS